MIPRIQQRNSWATPVGSDSGSGNKGFLGRKLSAMFSMDDLTAALYKEEERENKANQILPFPLEQVDELTATIDINLSQLKATLLQAYRSGLLKQSEKVLVKNAVKKLKKARQKIQSIAFDIDKMRL